MSRYYFIENSFNWEEGFIKEIENLENQFVLHLYFNPSAFSCLYCQSHKLHIKDYRDQKVFMGYWNFTPVYALIHKRRYIYAPAAIRLSTRNE